MTTDWAVFQGFLPEGWQSQARQLGAFTRRRRVPSPEALLQLLLAYSASGLSFVATAFCAETNHVTGHLSAPAFQKRLRKARPWLEWIVRNLLAQNKAAQQPLPVQRRFRIFDGSQVQHGKMRYRIHYSITLPECRCDGVEILEWKGAGSGESFRNWRAEPGDIVLGDLGYAQRSGVASVLVEGADFLVRIHPATFPLEDAEGSKVDPLEWVDSIQEGQIGETQVYFRHRHERFGPLRLVAKRLEDKKAETAATRAKRKSRAKKRTPREATAKAARWLLLLTSLDATLFDRNWICEAYRPRWQIELGLKRLKSLIRTGQIPRLEPESALAWLETKFVLALVGERMSEAMGAFSPSGN